jgi:hypothetical protein
MTQHERDTLVESYLGGEMTPDQESNFFLQVALDTELQRTLKAYRIMNRVLDDERIENITVRPKYRESVMALLAVTKAATVTGTAVTAAKGISSAASGGSVAGAGTATLAGIGIGLKVLLATILGASLVIGTIVVIDAVESNNEPTTGSNVPATELQLQQKPALAPPTVEMPSKPNELPANENATASTPSVRNEIHSNTTSKAREGEKRGSDVDPTVGKFKKPAPVTLSPRTNDPHVKAEVNPNSPKQDVKRDK